MQAVSNILSVFHLCLFCVSNQTKGVVSTEECGGAHRGRKRGGVQTVLKKCRKQKEDRGRESHSEDLQTELFSRLCLAAL